MTTLVTGTPGSGKTTLVATAQLNGDKRFYDADEILGLCEWREFKTGKVMGVVTDFVETGKDDWYTTYGWYWRTEVLKQFLVDHPDAIICGSSENVVECYELFDKLVIIRVEEKELISNLAQPTRNNPFGKTPKQRANFMNWQTYLIESAEKYNLTICSGNDTQNVFKMVVEVAGKV